MIYRRMTPGLTITLFVAALATSVTGWATSTAPLTDAGLIGLLAAVPLMYWVMITRTHEVTAEQIAQAEARGYVKALDHVGRGVIDVPPPPSPGQCEECGRDLSPADVISLNARRRPDANTTIEENRAVP
ncbi:hypothetical protein ACFY8P_35225 [Streptomyces sp. NPDC012693]|uniref:hypothetical protein n=1 Tax=Streptomyces sp. NPDC012693 TaxID=3364844 RepID=UPI0036A47333